MAKKGGKAGGGNGSNGGYVKCALTHPELKFTVKGKEYSIAGGTCNHGGFGSKYDIEIVLDQGVKVDSRQFPWNEGEYIRFPITDGQPPSNHEEFKKLIHWMARALRRGKTIHVGCIGGHGRTGTVLTALYAHMTKDPEAIQYVREHYCKKVVESEAQVRFLMKHWGATYAKPSKTWTQYGTGGGASTGGSMPWSPSERSTYQGSVTPFKPQRDRFGRKLDGGTYDSDKILADLLSEDAGITVYDEEVEQLEDQEEGALVAALRHSTEPPVGVPERVSKVVPQSSPLSLTAGNKVIRKKV